MLVEQSVRELLAAFASSAPTPGGGSASAVASAIGTSLLMMVAALPRTRSGSEEDRAALVCAARALAGFQQQLTEAIDLDTIAYDHVVTAYKLPKGSDAERVARTAAVQRALRGAIEVPLGVLRLSALALKEAQVIARHGQRAAASDVGVAVALLTAGARGARLNVEINLASVTDAVYTEAVKEESERLANDASRVADAADALLQD